MLIVMLLSIPLNAGVARMAEPASGVRIGLNPHRAFPAEFARRLCEGICFETPAYTPSPVAPIAATPTVRTAVAVVPLREALLDLPPPAAA